MQAQRDPVSPSVDPATVMRSIGQMPLRFVRNDGQWEPTVRFAARGRGYSAAFTSRGIGLDLRGRDEQGGEIGCQIELNFASDSRSIEPQGEQQLSGVHNFLVGNDPAKWRTNVATFQSVRYGDVAPGVSMVAHEREGRLQYDLEIEPGAHLSAFEVDCAGVSSVSIEADGTLELATPIGLLLQTPPKAWFETSTGETKVADCRFRVTGPTSYGIDVLNPDPACRLIVDPQLIWSTFLGVDQQDQINAIDVEGGLVTVAGLTEPGTFTNLPSTTGVYDPTQNGYEDAFVARFDPNQTGAAQLVWLTFLGGSADEDARGVGVTASGSVAVCGVTTSANFPTTGNAYQSVIPYGTGMNGFVSFLDSNGATLSYSSYYGGAGGITRMNALEVDGSSKITIVGYTESASLPMVNAYDSTYDSAGTGTPGDGLVATFDPLAAGGPGTLVYSSYLGGSTTAGGPDEAFGVSLESGFIYVGGFTTTGASGANSFLTTSNAYQPLAPGRNDGFIHKLDPSKPAAQQLVYGTYLGGTTNSDVIYDLAVKNGVIYAVGHTWGTPLVPSNFPLSTSGVGFEAAAFQVVFTHPNDAFVTKLNPTLSPSSQLRYSTLLGGSNDENPSAIVRIADRAVVVAGFTSSPNFPVTPGALKSTTTTRDGFMTQLNWANNRPPGQQLVYSTYLGGNDSDEVRGLVLDAPNAYLCGVTRSADFPITAGAFQPVHGAPGGTNSGEDGFACRFLLGINP